MGNQQVSQKQNQKISPTHPCQQNSIIKQSYPLDYEEHIQIFKEKLSCYDLELQKIKSDGNCLFRSISQYLEGTQKEHDYYRQLACDYMVNHPKQFKKFIFDEEYDHYIEKMRKLNSWGGDIEIIALSRALNASIIVLRRDLPPLTFVSPDTQDFQESNIILLAYHDEFVHYSSLSFCNHTSKNNKNNLDSFQIEEKRKILEQLIIQLCVQGQKDNQQFIQENKDQIELNRKKKKSRSKIIANKFNNILKFNSLGEHQIVC